MKNGETIKNDGRRETKDSLNPKQPKAMKETK